MICTTFARKKDYYIKSPSFENLYTIPYVKGRLVFAELVARAIENGSFDLILVDLPCFMNNEECLAIPARLFPMVSSLVILKGTDSYMTIPFVPNDAPCTAIAMVQMLREWGGSIDLRCIDDSNVINYHDYLQYPEVELKDDYFVFVDGVEEYFAQPFKQMENLWNNLPDTQRSFLEHRASIVKEYLDGYLRKGKQTLFICEYKLWWIISKFLEMGERDKKTHLFIAWKDLSAAIVYEDPYLLWAMGLLDDFPGVVLQFYSKLKEGYLQSFDKIEAINTLVKAAISQSEKRPSIREAVVFQRYLRKLLCASLRLTPLLVEHLYDAALSCVGKHFADVMARKFLHYPCPDMDKVLNYISIQKDTVLLTGEMFNVPELSQRDFLYKDLSEPSLNTPYDKRIDLVNKVSPRIDKMELTELNETGWNTWAVTEDYKLHEIACAKARNLADKKRSEVIIKRSLGSIGNGIHWRATITSRAKGEDAVYIRTRRHKSGILNRLNAFTPVVFLFSNDTSRNEVQTISDFNITQKLMALGKTGISSDRLPPPDYIYSVLYTCSELESFSGAGGHITKRKLSSIAFLYSSRVMGVDRYNDITKRPSRFQCRIHPLSDPDLKYFVPPEIGIAWAIKYAEDAVLVVARDGWKIPKRIETFATVNNVRIIYTPLSNFSYDFIERLGTLYLTSTALKNYRDRDKILRRFIE